MGAAAMAILWSGYTLGLWGWCLVRGKNASLITLANPAKVINWGDIGPAGNAMVFPDGGTAGAADAAGSSSSSSRSGTTDAGSGPSQPAGGIINTAAIGAAAAKYGWHSDANQWNAITHLVAGESGGRPDARNPDSGALGIAQALGHGTGCSAGSLGNDYSPQYGLSCGEARAANSGDAYQQARWMMGYIAAVYGTPAKAWSEWQLRSPHWY